MTRLVVIGGFLGSGKTSLLVTLARRIASSGRRVAVVTNDQGERLVDTAFVRAMGIEAVEVAHGCFCCNFSRFVGNVRRFVSTLRPDVILAEPVGSCTDLAATVLGPLARFHGDAVELAPYLALADGPRAASDGYASGVAADDVGLLLTHQLREAQLVVVSKADLLDGQARARARSSIEALSSGARVLCASSVTGEGLDAIESAILDSPACTAFRAVPIDYDRYAAAEAAYGWYDASWSLRSAEGFAAYAYAAALMRSLTDWDAGMKAVARGLGAGGTRAPEAGVAHAKLLLSFPDGAAKFSLSGGVIRSGESILGPELRRDGAATLNIRARARPEDIRAAASRALQAAEHAAGCVSSALVEDSFVPGRPVPEVRTA